MTSDAGARAWFSADAVELLEMVGPYLQVVAVPHTHAEDWPFRSPR
ncbi:hypothetical protein [Curtobacterium flaccumfaciens]